METQTIVTVKCEDTNGRKFSLMVDTDRHGFPSQEWIDRQNELRAKSLNRAAIVKWEVSNEDTD